MIFLVLAVLATLCILFANIREQRKRIHLLSRHLGDFQIEKLMVTLTDGYMRALSEPSQERRASIWGLLDHTENQLSEQFTRFAAGFSKVVVTDAMVSRLSVALPFAERLFPNRVFDMRKALSIHARGIGTTVKNTAHLSSKDKAFMLCAELLLMQHTCHWFCKSKTVASVRMLARHKTPHAQLVASVSQETRSAYLALIKGQ